MSGMVFKNRVEAGQLLAQALIDHADEKGVIVLGLPRGGVPVAAEVARRLHVPLDVLVVRKLGVPGHEELAMGAIASGGVRVLHDGVVSTLGVLPAVIEEVAAAQQRELVRRELAYRGHTGTPEIGGKTVILVDDGVATGSTIRAAVLALRQQRARKIVVAVPVSALDAAIWLRGEADEFVALSVPEDFHAVGQWYEDFSQTTDDEVKELLSASREAGAKVA